MNDTAREFSIVIPTYNEEANLDRCLRAIRQATEDARIVGVDVHVVDNCSTDGTVNVAAAHGASVIAMARRVSIATLRNDGARAAAGRVLLFLDADMEVPPDWLTVTRRWFNDDGADVLGFVESVPREAPWAARVWCRRDRARRPEIAEVDYLPGRNIACRRAFFEKVGGFDTDLKTAEDKDFVIRLKAAGATVVSDPGVRIRHWGYERDLRELARKEFWRQGNNINLVRRHGACWRLLRFPLISVAHVLWGMVVVAAMLSGAPAWALVATLVWFAPGALITLAARLNRRYWLYVLQLTFLNWLRYNVAGLAVIGEFIRGFSLKSAARNVA